MTASTLRAAAPADGSRVWIQWTLSNCGQLSIVSVAGKIDGANVDQLADVLRKALDAGSRRLIVDLSSLDFLDVAAAHALDSARRHAAALNLRLDVVCADTAVRNVLTLTGVGEVVGLHGTVTEALGAQSRSDALAANSAVRVSELAART